MPDTPHPTHEEILALETAFWDAMKAKDGTRAAALSAPTSLVTGERGVRSIPRPDMARMTEEGNWSLESYTLENPETCAPAPNVAIIAYTATQRVTMDGATTDRRTAATSTWVRGPNGWKCHAHSETPLAGTPNPAT